MWMTLRVFHDAGDLCKGVNRRLKSTHDQSTKKIDFFGPPQFG
jgi:hypothetical protein